MKIRAATGPVWWQGLKVQVRCIEALMIRDLMARYGRGNIGFLWVLLEPMFLCIGVMIVWSMLKGSTERGLNLVALVICGYMTLTLWRHITNRGVHALRHSVSAFYHRRISAIDCMISMNLLEIAGSTAALVIIVTTTWTLGFIEPIRDYSAFLLGWFMMASLSVGVMLVICALTESSEIWERFIQPFQYLQLPLSGAFFMVDWLPSYAQDIAWYNPTVHCYEMVRRGFFGDTIKTYADPWYAFAWAAALIVAGLWLLEHAREKASFR